jgi:anti-anti-sigma regulatory factor
MTVSCKPEHLFQEAVPGGLALYLFGPLFDHEDWLRDEAALDRIDDLASPEVYLDLGRLNRITSSGFGAILRIGRRAHLRGGRLVLCNTPPMVREAFKVMKLDALSWLVVSDEGVPEGRMRLPDPAWLAWGGGTVVALAQTIAESQEFTLLPILADALEEAGCNNDDILRHCREQADHVRECWLIRLLTGQEW